MSEEALEALREGILSNPDVILGDDQLMRALLAESKADPAAIEDVVMGCAFPEGEQGLNIARLASFLAGLPQAAGGVTVNRFCGSSMQAVHQAARSRPCMWWTRRLPRSSQPQTWRTW